MYTDQITIEAFLKRSLTDNEITILPLLVEVASTFIGNSVGGTYGTAVSSTRYYDGGGSSILQIDSAKEITKVASVDEGEEEVTEYDLNESWEARPRNATFKTWIERRWYKFPVGVANIAVTGKFTLGDDVPADLKYLATYLISKLFEQKAAGNLKSESIEGYSKTFADFKINDQIISSVLDKYIKDDVLL